MGEMEQRELTGQTRKTGQTAIIMRVNGIWLVLVLKAGNFSRMCREMIPHFGNVMRKPNRVISTTQRMAGHNSTFKNQILFHYFGTQIQRWNNSWSKESQNEVLKTGHNSVFAGHQVTIKKMLAHLQSVFYVCQESQKMSSNMPDHARFARRWGKEG